MHETTAATRDENLRDALPHGLWDWLKVFGPGAIIASLTIGTGELIFSSRGGAIFGYRILFVFAAISLLKFGLVVASARHIVLTGVHPYARMLELPGPRGWFLLVLFLVAAVCLPIWISFHSGVLGNFLSWVTGTAGRLGGGIDYVWGAAILAAALVITATGRYSRLERIQVVIVVSMVVCAGLTLVLYRPDWVEFALGALVPQRLMYPPWLAVSYPEIACQPVWVEVTRYVGVIGGGGFDYLAYTSYVRNKAWGQAGAGEISPTEVAELARCTDHPIRQWVRAPLIDCSLSFFVVVAFSAVFVASGTIVLGPQHKIPSEENLLSLQAAFVTGVHPWLLPLYIVGVFLTMFGTLYGTLEVACCIVQEMARCVGEDFAARHTVRVRKAVVTWCAVWACAILAWLCVYHFSGAAGRPRALLAILTPANLLTGVLGCGLLCLLNLWMDRRFLPRSLRLPAWLWTLNLASAIAFLSVGAKGAWEDRSRWYAVTGLGGVLVCGCLVSYFAGRRLFSSRRKP
jgi:hypothetical protein